MPKLAFMSSTMWRRMLKVKAKFESSPSYSSFNILVPGAYKVDLMGSTCAGCPTTMGRYPFMPSPSALPIMRGATAVYYGCVTGISGVYKGCIRGVLGMY